MKVKVIEDRRDARDRPRGSSLIIGIMRVTFAIEKRVGAQLTITSLFTNGGGAAHTPREASRTECNRV
jgi:hypothetical protein